MLGDHKTLDRYKRHYENADMSDDELRDVLTKNFIAADATQRANMLADMDIGLCEDAADLRQRAQLLNQFRYFRELHVGLKSRNR